MRWRARRSARADEGALRFTARAASRPMLIELPSERRQIGETNGRATAGRPFDFERLVADLSMRFINLPADQAERGDSRRAWRIGEALDLDRCTFYRVQSETACRPTRWLGASGSPARAGAATGAVNPWVVRHERSGRVVSFSSVDEIPNPIDRESFRAYGTRSGVTVPLSVDGTDRRGRRLLHGAPGTPVASPMKSIACA